MTRFFRSELHRTEIDEPARFREPPLADVPSWSRAKILAGARAVRA